MSIVTFGALAAFPRACDAPADLGAASPLAILRRAGGELAARPLVQQGRVRATGLSEAEAIGLPSDIRPGDIVLAWPADGAADPVVATVLRGEPGSVVLRPDRALRCGDLVRVADAPPPIDASWLGATLDAQGRRIDGGRALDPASDAPLSVIEGDSSDRAVTGVGAIDALCPILAGEAWALCGPAGSGRSTLLRMIAAEGMFDAVVHCAIGVRTRERAAFGDAANRILVLCHRGSGPAEGAMARALAVSMAGDLARRGLRTLLLVDGAPEVPRVPGVTSIAAVPAGSVHGPDVADGTLHLDADLAARGHHPALDLRATLATIPATTSFDAMLRRCVAGDDHAVLDALRERVRQGPRREGAAPDPGALVDRDALRDLVEADRP